MSSVGKVPFSQWSAMIGCTRASTNARTLCWMARSSSVKWRERSRKSGMASCAYHTFSRREGRS